MTITYELIGKLGGASVDVTPVSVTASGAKGSEVVMHTVTVPAGETWLVALVGDVVSGSGQVTWSPSLSIGNITTLAGATSGKYGLSGVATGGTIAVKITRKTNSGQDSFTGHVYAVKI